MPNLQNTPLFAKLTSRHTPIPALQPEIERKAEANAFTLFETERVP